MSLCTKVYEGINLELDIQQENMGDRDNSLYLFDRLINQTFDHLQGSINILPTAPPSRASSPILFVHLVSKPHSVNDGELETHIALLKVVRLSTELDTWLKVRRLKVLEVGVEQCVHQSGLPDTRLTCTEFFF